MKFWNFIVSGRQQQYCFVICTVIESQLSARPYDKVSSGLLSLKVVVKVVWF